MRFLKFSLLFVQLAVFAFNGTECFDSTFKVQVRHKSFPFGLLSKTLGIEKRGCELKISHNKWKYMNSKWIVDICRDPIHIKTSLGSVEVFRKVAKCNTVKNEFCNQYRKLKNIIEDDGLIFAEGQKNNLKMAHGQTYCSYVLLKEYLEKGVVLNLGHNYDYILGGVNEEKSNTPADSKFNVDPNAGEASF